MIDSSPGEALFSHAIREELQEISVVAGSSSRTANQYEAVLMQ